MLEVKSVTILSLILNSYWFQIATLYFFADFYWTTKLMWNIQHLPQYEVCEDRLWLGCGLRDGWHINILSAQWGGELDPAASELQIIH